MNETSPGKLTQAIRLDDPVSGRTLEVYTTEPGLQIYTGNSFNGSTKDSAGRPIEKRGGIALETQHFPDSPNHPDYLTTVLRQGQTFRSTTQFRFVVFP